MSDFKVGQLVTVAALSHLLNNLPQINPGCLFSKRNLQTLPVSGLDDRFDFCVY
jgi:hypothetical protein